MVELAREPVRVLIGTNVGTERNRQTLNDTAKHEQREQEEEYFK